jgi:hypothetical protein
MTVCAPSFPLGRVALAPCLALACSGEVTEATTVDHGTTATSGTSGGENGESGAGRGSHSDTSEAHCGDGVVQEGEECDGEDMGEVTCQTYGFEDGIVTCSPNCRAITNACWTCGDAMLHPAKTCDGDLLRGETCATQGYAGGALLCADDCRGYDTTQCEAFPSCGNGVLDPGEQCDGDQLSGHDCQNFGYDTGMLKCSAECVFDTSGCDYHPLDCGVKGSWCWMHSQCCPAGVGGNHLGNCYGQCT